MRDAGAGERYAPMPERIRTISARPIEVSAVRQHQAPIADPYPMPQPVAGAPLPPAHVEPISEHVEPPALAAPPPRAAPTNGFNRGLHVQPVAPQPAAIVEPPLPPAPEPEPFDAHPFIPPAPEGPPVRT